MIYDLSRTMRMSALRISMVFEGNIPLPVQAAVSDIIDSLEADGVSPDAVVDVLIAGDETTTRASVALA